MGGLPSVRGRWAAAGAVGLRQRAHRPWRLFVARAGGAGGMSVQKVRTAHYDTGPCSGKEQMIGDL